MTSTGISIKRNQITKDEKILFLVDMDPENRSPWDNVDSSSNTVLRYQVINEALEMIVKRKSNFSEHRFALATYYGLCLYQTNILL